MLGVLGQPIADHEVARQLDARPAGMGGLGQGAARVLGVLVVAQRVANGVTLGAQEREAHGPADDHHVGDIQEAVDDRDLVRHLGSADDRHERPRRAFEDRRQRRHLLLEQAPRGTGKQMRDALRAGVRTVSGAERIVDVGIGEFGQCGRELADRCWSRPARSARSRAPAPRRRRAASVSPLTCSPTTAGASVTGASVRLRSLATTGASERSSSRRPSGRPRWETSTSLAPRPRSSSIVRSAATMRVSSATTGAPSASLPIGTLKSTRTSTRLPCTSRSSRPRHRPLSSTRHGALTDSHQIHEAV